MDATTRETLQRQYSQITAKAWADPDYKKRLLADPVSVLREAGVDVGSRHVNVVENTDDLFYFVLKPKPADLSGDHQEPPSPDSCVATECDICATH